MRGDHRAKQSAKLCETRFLRGAHQDYSCANYARETSGPKSYSLKTPLQTKRFQIFSRPTAISNRTHTLPQFIRWPVLASISAMADVERKPFSPVNQSTAQRSSPRSKRNDLLKKATTPKKTIKKTQKTETTENTPASPVANKEVPQHACDSRSLGESSAAEGFPLK